MTRDAPGGRGRNSKGQQGGRQGTVPTARSGHLPPPAQLKWRHPRDQRALHRLLADVRGGAGMEPGDTAAAVVPGEPCEGDERDGGPERSPRGRAATRARSGEGRPSRAARVLPVGGAPEQRAAELTLQPAAHRRSAGAPRSPGVTEGSGREAGARRAMWRRAGGQTSAGGGFCRAKPPL